MQQPEIEVFNVIDNKSWGVKKIVQMNWTDEGILWCILVEFIKGSSENLAMYNYGNEGVFCNSHGNLMGKLNK
jgi:hypothetical protein